MKSNFKYIIFGILFCLAAVFVWQLYWLRELYSSIEQKTRATLIECVKNADELEVIMRMNLVEEASSDNEGSIVLSMGSEDGNITKTKTVNINGEQQEDTTNISFENDAVKHTKLMYELFSEAIITTHNVVDTIKPIDIDLLKDLIKHGFEQRNPKVTFQYVEAVRLESDSVFLSSRDSSMTYGQSETILYEYNPVEGLYYRVYTKPLMKSVFIQMSGILTSTVLIIIILAFAFHYLIRTVLRQKTLEEMKDDFTNNMTHELKTPIAVAYSATDVLLNFSKDDDEAKRQKYLRICKEQLNHLTGLVEQILSMSMEQRKTFALNREQIALKELIGEVIEQHKLKASKTVTFSFGIEPDDLQINADRTHLRNMVSNLIDNAIKYSNEKVDVRVNVSVKTEYCLIAISDTGIGVASDKQDNIFNKFYRVPHGNVHDVKGYGLGLFYVKTMAEKHHGNVKVKSALGKGSVFTIRLPYSDSQI